MDTNTPSDASPIPIFEKKCFTNFIICIVVSVMPMHLRMYPQYRQCIAYASVYVPLYRQYSVPREDKPANSDIFGAARPVDTASKELEIESKLHKSPNTVKK